MHEDFLKFRKLCEVLKTEKGWAQKKFLLELDISQPTFNKLLKADIETIKFHASILGIIQDFIRKHIDDLNYAGIRPDPETVERMRKDLSNYQPAGNERKENKEPGSEIEPEPGNQFLDLLNQLSKLIPANVQIIINPNK